MLQFQTTAILNSRFTSYKNERVRWCPRPVPFFLISASDILFDSEFVGLFPMETWKQHIYRNRNKKMSSFCFVKATDIC